MLFSKVIPLTPQPSLCPKLPPKERKFLTPDEVEKLLTAAKQIGRHRHRDYTMLLMAYRHGLRVSELVALKWSQVFYKQAELHVVRRKNGTPAAHPLTGPELRALRKLQRLYPDTPYLFISERHAPLTRKTVYALVTRAAKQAGFDFRVSPHSLRHSCGYKLVNDGQPIRAIQQYLGHRNIEHTVRYTELAPGQFDGFWVD